MRTAIAGFLSVFLVTGAIGLLIAWQERRAFYRDPDISAVLEAVPEAGDRLRRAEREAITEGARRLITHVLLLGCLILTGLLLSQRAANRKLQERAQRWRALSDDLRDERRALQAELHQRGPQIVRHSRDRTYSALCAKCGSVVTQRFEERAEAIADRTRTEVEGCLACPSEARGEGSARARPGKAACAPPARFGPPTARTASKNAWLCM